MNDLTNTANIGEYKELNENSVVEYVQKKVDFFDDDSQLTAKEIGDGNLNLVFRVVDALSNKSIIVKQALPYVRAAGESWPLDINRGKIETNILKIEYDLTDGLVPYVHLFDEDMYCMVMEDLSDYVIMRNGLLDQIQYPHFAEQITDFIVNTLLKTSDVAMDHKEKKEYVKNFINPELCDITEDLVYTEPFNTGARNDMEDDLVSFHKSAVVDDKQLSLEVAKLKFDFMNNAQALLHGDLHTGSIFVNQDYTKVIDPEFAFYGPIAYDIGALVANLIMNYISISYNPRDAKSRQTHLDYLLYTTSDIIELCKQKTVKIWDEIVTDKMAKTPGFRDWYIEDILVNTAGVCGCEMIRRTVGFAHVKDLDSIPDDTLRIEAKKLNIMMAKELILNRSVMTTGSSYVRLIQNNIKGN